MSRRTFAIGRSTATPGWDGTGVRPDGWEGSDDGWDIDFMPPDDPDAIAAAMDAAKAEDKLARERIVQNTADIPPLVLRGIQNYVNYGVPVGDFLTAVLENDLHKAVSFADDNSFAALKQIMMLLYNDAPSACWGSPAKVERWQGMDTEHRDSLTDNPDWRRFMEVASGNHLTQMPA